ncbi:MAG TPA: glycosyltransferase family 39 protein [Candidatus Saccharimonadales bacterium]
MKLRSMPRLTMPRVTLFALVGSAVAITLFKLGSLVPGFAGAERQLPSLTDSLQSLWNDPLSLPFTLSQAFVAAIAPSAGYTVSRLPAVLLGLLLVALIYWLLKQWYGTRLALFGVLLLITAPWFLHVARVASPSIQYALAMSIVLVLAMLWHKKERPRKLLYATALAAAGLLYIPGAVWLLICVLLAERHTIIGSIKHNTLHTTLASLLGLAALTPLIHSLIVDWHRYASYLGWFGGLDKITDYGQQFVLVWWHIFVGGYTNPTYNLAGLALTNIFMTLSFVVGLYLYSRHPKATRTRLLLALWLVATALVTLPGPVHISLLLPLVIVVVTGGIGYLLHLWLKVFPRNPLARWFGIGLVALVVLFAVGYNLRSYFVAWPNNADTRTTFSRQL